MNVGQSRVKDVKFCVRNKVKKNEVGEKEGTLEFATIVFSLYHSAL